MSDMDTDSDSGIDDTPSQSYPQYNPQLEYTTPPTRLQTLDLWLPRPLEDSDPKTTTFVIYIHGGAWRDPTQDATCIQPTLAHLLHTTASSSVAQPHPALEHIAGIASLDYRLSPYPNHPTDPSEEGDESRNAKWPDHIQDVRTAVKWLGERYGVGSRYPWIGVGHSCGATLLAQLVAGTGVENQVGEGAVGPQSLVLMAGIYDLRAMLENHQPPVCPLHIAKIYEEFVQGAFGTDTKGHYTAVSPSSGTYTVETCPRLKEIVLAYSASDELIEPQQRAIMAARLKDCGWVERGQAGERIVEMKDLTQGHDEVWQDGQQVAGLIGEAVGRMFGAI